MTPSPRVSIVLPVYNGAQYLAEAIESCQAQTFVDWELIVVDDASTDGSPEIIARYCAKDARVQMIRHEINRKLPAALNSGFSVARGNFLTWTSDDNQYRPVAIEEMLGYLNAHAAVDIVYADYTLVDSLDVVMRRVEVQEPVYLVRGNVVGPCFLYRRSVQESLGRYDETLFLVEDYDFWLRAAACLFHRMRPLHQDLYLYRWHETSLSALHLQRVPLAHERALSMNLPRLWQLPPAALVAGWTKVAVMARRRGDYRACAAALFNAVRKSPSDAVVLLAKILINGPSLINFLKFKES